PPTDHDARDPAPRADLIEQEVARDLEGGVAEEEDSGGQAELRGRQAELLVHRQRGDAEAGAVEIIKEIGDRQQRHEPDRGLFYRALQRGIGCVHPRYAETAGSALLQNRHPPCPCPFWLLLLIFTGLA